MLVRVPQLAAGLLPTILRCPGWVLVQIGFTMLVTS